MKFSQKHFFKFMLVRHPMERLVSCYFDKMVNGTHKSLKGFRKFVKLRAEKIRQERKDKLHRFGGSVYNPTYKDDRPIGKPNLLKCLCPTIIQDTIFLNLQDPILNQIHGLVIVEIKSLFNQIVIKGPKELFQLPIQRPQPVLQSHPPPPKVQQLQIQIQPTAIKPKSPWSYQLWMTFLNSFWQTCQVGDYWTPEWLKLSFDVPKGFSKLHVVYVRAHQKLSTSDFLC